MTPASPAAAPARQLHAAVLLLGTATFLAGAALRICDGLIPRLAGDFGVSPGTAGGVVLYFAIAYGLLQLVFGPLGDRWGKLRVIVAALAGCSVAALASATAGSFPALLVLRATWGVFAAGVIPVALAWIGDVVHYEERQPTLAKLMMGTLTGMMAGQLAGGLFADSALGWRGAFVAMAAGYAVVVALLLARLRGLQSTQPQGAPTGQSFATQLRQVLATPWARIVLAVALAEGIFMLGPLAFLPAYLHQRFAISLSAASALMMLYAAGGLVYAMLARQLVRRLGERRMAASGGAVMGAGFLAWWLVPGMGSAGGIALLVGFGSYLLHNTLQTHATQMAPALRGTAMALFACCLFFGQALGVSAAGAAWDRFGSSPLLLAPALVRPLVGWAFATALARRAARG